MTRFCIQDGGFLGHPVDATQLRETLVGLQPRVRERCHVVTLTETARVPADEWLDRMRRAVAETIPPSEDEEVTKVEVIR